MKATVSITLVDNLGELNIYKRQHNDEQKRKVLLLLQNIGP